MDSIKEKLLELSLEKLAAEFRTLDLTFHRMENGRASDVTSYWPGNADEDVMICVFKGMRTYKWSKRELTNAALYLVDSGCKRRQLPLIRRFAAFLSPRPFSGLWEGIMQRLVIITRKTAGLGEERGFDGEKTKAGFAQPRSQSVRRRHPTSVHPIRDVKTSFR